MHSVVCSKQEIPPIPHGPSPQNTSFRPPQCTLIGMFSITVPGHPVKFHTLMQWSGPACCKQGLPHPYPPWPLPKELVFPSTPVYIDQPVLRHSPRTSSQILHINAVIRACAIACSKQGPSYPDPHPHPKNMSFHPPQCTLIGMFSVTVPGHPVKFYTLMQWSEPAQLRAVNRDSSTQTPTCTNMSFHPPQYTLIRLFSVTVPRHPVKFYTLMQWSGLACSKQEHSLSIHPRVHWSACSLSQSLSTLSLSKSPVLSNSRTSLLSHSLTDLYRSNDSLSCPPG